MSLVLNIYDFDKNLMKLIVNDWGKVNILNGSSCKHLTFNAYPCKTEIIDFTCNSLSLRIFGKIFLKKYLIFINIILFVCLFFVRLFYLYYTFSVYVN